MGDIIHLLPDTVANQIAAGEVIQRPSSVVKELVENAIDAKAKNIDIFITDAGKTGIQVIDDGIGMSETDARLAFERHATSKIKQATDLYSLSTMGFRGEALPSIVAVSQVELTSRTKDSELGVHLSMAASRVVSQEPKLVPVGSNFIVNNLFFNIPARRRFLKSNATEMSNIMTEYERIALANPSIGFSISHNGVEIIRLSPAPFKKRIIDIFGKKYNQTLLPINVDTSIVKVSGFIGTPSSSKKKGAHQFFFVNNRYMKHPYFHRAVMSAYEKLIPIGEQIPYFVCFNIDSMKIDVNIHPTKTEIKFEEENAVWQILSASAKESLGRHNAVPAIDFSDDRDFSIPVFPPAVDNSISIPRTEADRSYNPFDTTSNSYSYRKPATSQIGWEKVYEGSKTTEDDDVLPELPESETEVIEPESNIISDAKSLAYYQYKGTYIITSIASGMMIIDQHRAHERVLFDLYMSQLKSRNGTSQRLLFPEILQIPPSRADVMKSLMDDLHSIGFEFSDLGGGSFAISAQPSGTEGLNAKNLVENIIDDAIDGSYKVQEDVFRHIAASMARKAAIVVGQLLCKEEMEDLVDKLFACKSPNYTPNGKLILTIIPQEKIEQIFR